MIDIHIHCAFKNPTLAGGTDTALAGKRQIHTIFHGAIQHIVSINRQWKVNGPSIPGHGDLTDFATVQAAPFVTLGFYSFRIITGSKEQLIMNVCLIDIGFAQSAGTDGLQPLRAGPRAASTGAPGHGRPGLLADGGAARVAGTERHPVSAVPRCL